MGKHKKITVGIIFGGRSEEHEVSIQSAKNIIQALDVSLYTPVLIGIDKNGSWCFQDKALPLLEKTFALPSSQTKKAQVQTSSLPAAFDLNKIDVFFPVLHGPYGEDGTVQGMLKLANKPFVGSDVLGSAICMDKDITKRLLKEAGLPVVDYKSFTKTEKQKIDYKKLVAELSSTLFIKPANLGSSVGITKAKNEKEFYDGIDEAFLYDSKILVEKAIDAREIECSVLGNENPKASLLGEIKPHDEFYSYQSKYIDSHGAELIIPAELSEKLTKQIQDCAIKAFKILECRGMARVDFFVEKRTNNVYINELNTIPGFTNISMYPKLWEKSGLSYQELVSRLIHLALKR
ncbi:MAG: D-alanine--D-alanine ligase [Candidatus Levybacteria bacterium]|nr:D-alanine--D-alanine ligase [Candidatus Levybacteria bacterium]